MTLSRWPRHSTAFSSGPCSAARFCARVGGKGAGAQTTLPPTNAVSYRPITPRFMAAELIERHATCQTVVETYTADRSMAEFAHRLFVKREYSAPVSSKRAGIEAKKRSRPKTGGYRLGLNATSHLSSVAASTSSLAGRRRRIGRRGARRPAARRPSIPARHSHDSRPVRQQRPASRRLAAKPHRLVWLPQLALERRPERAVDLVLDFGVGGVMGRAPDCA